jgi:superfamily II DNA/RNA helicase
LVENPNALMAFEGLAELMREAGLRKVKPAAEFIENLLDSEDQVVVFVHHKDVAAQLAEALKKHKPAVITGDTPRKQRDTYIDEFQAHKRRIIVGTLLDHNVLARVLRKLNVIDQII